jgi:drug/metabolite transporter (DMT)-like permease
MQNKVWLSTGPIIAAFCAVVIWGASPAATAVAGRGIPPELIAGLRTLLGGLVVLPLLLLFRGRFPADWQGRFELITSGVFGFAAYPLILTFGVMNTSVTHASVILAAAPIFTGLFSFILTRHWPRSSWWIGGAMALAGIAILMTERMAPNANQVSATLMGDALVLLSVMFASVGYVYGGRTAARMGQWPGTVWSITIGALAFAPFILPAAVRFDWSSTGATELAALAFLAVMVTVIGYALWFWALAETGAARVAPLQFLQPLVGILLAASVLGESIMPSFILPVGLTLLGVWVTRRGQ